MKPWNAVDKILWKVMNTLAGLVVPIFVKLRITPNQLTTISSIVNLSIAFICFTHGSYNTNILGLIFLIIHSYFDFVDGKLARKTGKTSNAGAFIDSRFDILGGQIIIIGLIVGLLISQFSVLFMYVSALSLIGKLGILVFLSDYERKIYFTDFRERYQKIKKKTVIDRILKEFITLESSPFLFLGTLRYFLFIMVMVNLVVPYLLISGIFDNIRWICMFYAYAKGLDGKNSKQEIIKLMSRYVYEKENE